MVPWFTNHLSQTKSSVSFVVLVLLIVNLLQTVHSASISVLPGHLIGNLFKTNLQSFYKVSSAATRPSHQYLSSHTHSVGTPQKDTDTILLDQCMSRPLSSKLWMEMGMNEFLRDYRNGENLNLLVLVIFHALCRKGEDFSHRGS
jgi:hypothetical protein